MSEPNLCSCRPKDECHQVSRVETGQRGKWRMVRVRGVCTHNRLDGGERGRARTSQMSLCQREPGTNVEHLHGERGSGLVQTWLSSVPTLMSSSGCHISLEITFQPLWSSQPLITEGLSFDFFFLCYIVSRILILWPDVEVVPPALEAQRHNHWASRTAGHPGKSWCLYLRNSVVSSNAALAPPSPGGPSW